MNYLMLLTVSDDPTGSWISMGISVALMFIVFYFFLIRPQKKEQKKIEAMLSDMAVGDYVLTTSGFYGVLIDITEDTVIIELGSNKNCRFAMKKSAIAQVEKPDAAVNTSDK